MNSHITDREELFSKMLNHSEDGIVYYKALRNESGELIDYIFEFMNDSTLNVISGTVDDYLGKKLLTLFPGNKKSGLWNDFKKTLETGIPTTNLYWYDDEQYKAWYKNIIVKYGDGLIVYFRDETDNVNKREQIEKLLKEKDILLQETHHRVKNNLQLVASLLNLQINESNHKDPLDILQMAKQRISSIAAIHERLYYDRNFRTVNLEHFVYDLIKSVEASYGTDNHKTKYTVNVLDAEYSINTCINISLILNELLTNCHKHAFSDNNHNEIKISIERNGADLLLGVGDNGKGIPSNFDISELSSLGLTLVKSLVEQMDGNLSIKSENPGTSWYISFPHPI